MIAHKATIAVETKPGIFTTVQELTDHRDIPIRPTRSVTLSCDYIVRKPDGTPASLIDLIDFLQACATAAREHRRLTFIYRSSPSLYQKIILRQLRAADEAQKAASRA